MNVYGLFVKSVPGWQIQASIFAARELIGCNWVYLWVYMDLNNTCEFFGLKDPLFVT